MNPLRNVTELSKAWMESGWVAMADGTLIQMNPLRNVTELSKAWVEWGWVAMADDVMILLNPLRDVTLLNIAWMKRERVATVWLCGTVGLGRMVGLCRVIG